MRGQGVIEGKKTIKCLLSDIVNDFSSLLNQHIELYKHEVHEEAKYSAIATMSIIVGALIAYTSLIFIGFFFLFLFNLFLASWLSALLVAILYILTSVATIFIAKRYLNLVRKTNESVFDETTKTMESIKRWLQKLI